MLSQLSSLVENVHSSSSFCIVASNTRHSLLLNPNGAGLREVKKKEGLNPTDDLYDHVGRFELSVNEFKAQLTEKLLVQKGIQGQQAAQDEHKRVGRIVRETVHREAGIYPEDLKSEPPITAMESLPKRKLGMPHQIRTPPEISN